MAVTPPPAVTPAPIPLPQRGDRTTFSSRVDAFVTWFVLVMAQMAALAANVYNNALDAAASALAAFNSAGSASTSAGNASTSAGNAAGSAASALTSANNAAASAATIGTAAAFSDSNPVVKGNLDPSKQLRFEVDGFTSGATRVVTVPDKSGTVMMLEDGSVTLLASMVPTAVVNIDFPNVFNSTFDSYVILLSGIAPSTNNDGLLMRFFNAGVIDSSAVHASVGDGNVTAGVTTAFFASISNVNNPAADPLGGVHSRLEVFNVNGSNSKVVVASHGFRNSTSGFTAQIQKHLYSKAATVSGIRFYWNSLAAFAPGGRIRIFGYRNS